MSDPRPLRAGSVRRRTIIAVVALVAVLLIVLSVVVDIALGARLRGQIEERLRDRAAAAASLVGTVDDEDLAERLSDQGLAVRIDSAGGESVVAGPSPEQLRHSPPGPGGPGPAQPSVPTPAASSDVRVVASSVTGDDDLVTLSSTLSDGSTLTLTASAAGVDETLAQVRWIMALASVGVLVLAAVAVTVVVRGTLRPLDQVSEIARSIGAGDRDRRLNPTRSDTEIGRVAAALDDMIDDVTGAEQAARQAETRLRAFLSDAAHELRTPVAGIRAAADTLVRADLDGPEREMLAAHVAREATRASRLVDDLLTMARVDQGLDLTRSDIDLRALVTAEVERAHLVHPSVRVCSVLPDAVVPVRVDAGRIAQVLSNLVENAARATGGRGSIELEVSVTETAAAVAVSDDGPGVAEADRERIFERLVRLDAARAGTGVGLGLPIARGIARAHDGDVRYAPRTGGARFALTLPLRGRYAT
ncbi:sensor histidine kinase [Microbacterium trichothecenolyticum]|uniref:histidine kinase n=1 Tax=Microbacterium trichothecenolyticum TaxID=69370 RepID=A0ABU0TT64_MICTR|nr:HAMP domain-containing sensor histidine kinase [Microbacterium trichothecenolyticum]MDQ1122132.1 two-component system OmpR family sensor kinase [Microbacterium trichothecenolyticum]